MIKKIILFTLLFLLIPIFAWAGTYYIRDDASGTWGTGSGECGHVTEGSTNPCSIATANTSVAAGDTVILQDDGGDFDEAVIGMLGGYDGNGDPTMASGSSGNWITWEAESGDIPTLVTGNPHVINLEGLSYHHFKNITVKCGGNKSITLRDDSSNNATHHIIFEGCTFYPLNEWAWSFLGMDGKANNVLLYNNTFVGYNLDNQTMLDLIYFVGTAGETGEKFLIDGNTMTEAAGHVMVEFQTNTATVQYIIIRNNEIENQIHTGINIYGTTTTPDYVLVENNVIHGSGSACSLDGDCSEMISWSGNDNTQAREAKVGLQLASQYSIIRYNEFYKNGQGINLNFTSNACNDNYIYNNVFYKNCRGFRVGDWGHDLDETFLINNIFRDNTESTASATNFPFTFDLHSSSNYDIEVSYNLEDETIDSYYRDPSYIKTQTFNEMDDDGDVGGTIWHDNEEDSVLFADEGSYNFSLQSGSPAIDAGGPLTLVNDAGGGSGTSLVVDDATPFHDGSWCVDAEMLTLTGLTCQADYICVGDNTTCSQISSITGDTITLVSSFTWDNNDPVYLQRDSDGTIVLFGSAPDIGADEYGGYPTILNGCTMSGGVRIE